jgi:hypothetical protein
LLKILVDELLEIVMNYRMSGRSLFLDDLREAPRSRNWSCVARNVREAQLYCETHGVPEYLSFDHDLGSDEPTGYDFAKALVETDLDQNGNFIPRDFQFHVHSANPVGRVNIQSLLDSYLSHRKKTS